MFIYIGIPTGINAPTLFLYYTVPRFIWCAGTRDTDSLKGLRASTRFGGVLSEVLVGLFPTGWTVLHGIAELRVKTPT